MGSWRQTPAGMPSAPGNVPKYSSKLRFSCMMNTKCLILSSPGGIGGGEVATGVVTGGGVLIMTLPGPGMIHGPPEGLPIIRPPPVDVDIVGDGGYSVGVLG